MPKKRAVTQRESQIEDKVVENMVKLQKIHTDLAEKFDKLAKEISSLLSLFELAAKSFSKSPTIKTTETDKEFLDKIDKLLEQNKTIAKGLTLMEEQIRKKPYNETTSAPVISRQDEYQESSFSERTSSRPLPKF
ncbi:MAG: hypothetical protein AABX83_01760 [Nanoarchaeota archaeon]